jgi:two-component system response regulator ChvI
VERAPSAEAGLALVPDYAPSRVVVALSPGSAAGKACLAALRQASQAAVIFLVAPEERDTVPEALWQGASDCLVKPFHVRELIARTRAILRRHQAAAQPPPRDMVRWLTALGPQRKSDPMLQ